MFPKHSAWDIIQDLSVVRLCSIDLNKVVNTGREWEKELERE